MHREGRLTSQRAEPYSWKKCERRLFTPQHREHRPAPSHRPACSRPQRISSFHRDGPKPSRPRTAKESVRLGGVGDGDARLAGGLALGPLRGGAAEEEAPTHQTPCEWRVARVLRCTIGAVARRGAPLGR